MLKHLFGRMSPEKNRPVEKRKRVSCDELSRVLCFEGVPKAKESVRNQGMGSTLGGCVRWSYGEGSDNERGYESIELCVRNLEIEITDYRKKHYTDHDAEIRYGLSDVSASLRFEDCHFLWDNIWETGIKFVPGFYDPDRGESLSFVKNTDAVGCSFSFPDHSRVVFEQNDFPHILVKRNDNNKSKGMSLKFKGNKFSGNNKSKGVFLAFKGNKFRRLDLDFPFPCEYPVSCRFFGGNEIDVLQWDQVVNRREFDHQGNIVKYDDVQEYNLFSIFFGRNEKIGWDVGDLFVRLRNLARMRGDIGQENIIASYISLVEYAEVKNSEWYKSWRGWQDWLLLGWRWVSSGFYMSWLRPIVWLIGGYLVLNAIPFLFLWGEGLSFDGYWEFCFLSPTKIPFYADGLNAVLGGYRYGMVLWGIGKSCLNFIGVVRLVWIALCSYAFKNAIRTYWPR